MPSSYDIFNGDADGICALQQLRLSEPKESQLITGVKRDVRLVREARAVAGDHLTVLDISLAENREALEAALDAGASCLYFDHHFAGAIPTHPRFEAHIRYSPNVCTSLLVDEYLAGRFRSWAVVAAFGDNLRSHAAAAARSLGLAPGQLELMQELGECINYNAYGDSLEDLYFHPAALYQRLRPYADPLKFAAQDDAFDTLRTGYRRDMEHAQAVAPLIADETHYAVLLPDAPWSRRVHGVLANRLASAHPHRAHAVLVQHGDRYRISVRAPLARLLGADEVCRRFPGGGGRAGAGGINDLPPERLEEFVRTFRAAFQPS
ncbi:MAG: acetyltransferase [Proteobacteria bacterium]|nr:MAG: acetyltransferase [Pseudomonadota bacterium]